MDDIDNQIIDALVSNGRASFRELGEAVSLSAHAVAQRVRRLCASGVITGFTALVDEARLGRSFEALVDVRLAPTTSPDRFESEVRSLVPVRELTFLTGRFDYQVRLACRDADELDKTVRHLRQEAGAAVTETRVVLRSTVIVRAPT
jgi:Lrp/AsnC family leucine-responsive transcriptional regulator